MNDSNRPITPPDTQNTQGNDTLVSSLNNLGLETTPEGDTAPSSALSAQHASRTDSAHPSQPGDDVSSSRATQGGLGTPLQQQPYSPTEKVDTGDENRSSSKDSAGQSQASPPLPPRQQQNQISNPPLPPRASPSTSSSPASPSSPGQPSSATMRTESLHSASSPSTTNPFRRPSPSLTPPVAQINFEEEDPFSVAGVEPPPYSKSELSSEPDIALASSSSVSSAVPVPAQAAIPVVASAVNSGSSPAIRSAASTSSQPVNEYVLKPIDWIDPTTSVEKRLKIITQNENGPCPLLALCNTLILQGKLSIRPYDRPSISYDHLLELLADYLLHEEEEGDSSTASNGGSTVGRVGERVKGEKIKSRLEIESALRLLPHLEHGLDVNVFFKTIRGFESTAELGLFHTFGVELVHGWVVSPVMDPAMHELVDGPAGITSYNKAVECIVSGDDAGGGLVVEDLMGNATPISPSNQDLTGAGVPHQDVNLQNERISHALVVQEFMNATRTQLTQYGLHVLQESLPEGHLCAFFRNNHFCTLFKNPMDATLYTLVTDQSLAHEQSIVWESLVDVDGAGDFLDGLFRKGDLEVGDYARNNQPIEARLSSHGDGGGDEDFALALQLQQQEEEEEARRVQKSKQTSSSSQAGASHNSLSTVNPSVGSSSHGVGYIAPSHQQPPRQLYQQPLYETDEQMAARLQREYSQQEHQEQQQSQQYQQQQQQPQQHYAERTSQSQYRPNQPQNPQGYGQTPARAPQGVAGHGRYRNSSEGSGGSQKDKDKCIIS